PNKLISKAHGKQLARTKAGGAGLREAAVVFCRLCTGESVHSLSPTAIPEAVELVVHAAGATGGVFEKISHDDKGLMVSIAFPDTSSRGVENAVRLPNEIAGDLRELGFAPAFGLACGMIYMGKMLVGGNFYKTIHGPAVNRAAKLLAQRDKAVSIDA